MPVLENQLNLERCPHCNVDKPSLPSSWQTETKSYNKQNARTWKIYVCARCGGLIAAAARQYGADIIEIYPPALDVDVNIPDPAREYLKQAMSSFHAPAGAIMLAASSVDAMLKKENYITGSLYERINQALHDHLITKDMAKWAHEVRLDANEQRHADHRVSLPDENDARRCIDFVLALGSFLFVLPARVRRGIADATGSNVPIATNEPPST